MAKFAEGVDAKFLGKLEATFDTNAAFASSDSMGLIDLKLEPNKEFHLSKERVGSPSAQAMAPGMRVAKWTAISEVKPNAAGVAPDIGALIKAAMGTETVNASTSVVYTLDSNAPSSLQLAREVGSGLYEVANGAWVEQLDIEMQANTEPKITAQGAYATHGHCYGTTVANDAIASATVVEYATAQKGNISKNARIKFGSEDNAGAGYLVTAVDDTQTPPELTISPALANGITAGDVIAPVTPSVSISGTLLGGISCGASVDGTAVHFRGAKLSIKTGIHGRDKEVSSDRAIAAFRGAREITGELTFSFVDTETASFIGRAWSGSTRAIVIRIGPDTAAQRMKLSIPKAFVEVTPIEVPEADESTFTLKFRALQSAAANDELTITFD